MTAVANWVKQAVSGTPGVGTITLGSASTGFIAIGDAFPHDMILEYMIEDGTEREHGLGTYTHSGTTLARTRIIETLKDVGGYSASAGQTGISCTSSAIVYLAVGSSTLKAPSRMAEGDDADISLFANINIDSTTGDETLTANRQTYWPVFLPGVEDIEAFWVLCSTAGAGSKSRMALYMMGTDGKPANAPIIETADATPALDVLPHTFTAQAIQPGWYFLSHVQDSNMAIRDYTKTELQPTYTSHIYSMSDGGINVFHTWWEDIGSTWQTGSLAAPGTLTAQANWLFVSGFRRV